MPTRLVIIESPYAGNTERNTKYARLAVRDSLERGESPIASHLLYTQPNILDENNPSEREWGIRAGLDWLPCANLMAVYMDLGLSSGVMNAIERASEIGLKIEFRRIEKWNVGDVGKETAQ